MPIPKLSGLNNKHVLALIGNFVISGFNFLIIGLLCRVLSKDDVGIWFFFLTIGGLADALRNGLLTTATVKFYAGTQPQRAAEVLGSVWYLAIAVTLGLLAVDGAAMPFLGHIPNREVAIVIKWFGITFLSSLPYSLAFWVLIADENYLAILWLRLVNSGGMVLIIAVMAFLHKATLQNLLIINLLTNVITSVVCFASGHSKFTTLFKRTKQCTRELFAFGKFSLASNISSNLLGSANTFIINFMLGPGALAVFNIPNKLMEIVEIPLRSFVGTGMSAMAAAYNTNNMYHLAFVSKKYAGMLTLVFVPVAVVTFFMADFAIWILGGDKYIGSEAANILRILMFFSILYPIDRFNGVTLDIIHQPKVNFYKVILMGVVNIVVACLGILALKNVYGVAIATPCATIAGIWFGYYHLRKHIKYTLSDIITLGYTELNNFVNEKILKKAPVQPPVQ